MLLIKGLYCRLEKIVKLEVNIATGKNLDEEQLILYSSKSSVEKAIADIGALKTQLEEIAAQVFRWCLISCSLISWINRRLWKV